MAADDLTTFTAHGGLVQVRRGARMSPLSPGGPPLRWARRHADVTAAARAMLVVALDEPEPQEELVRAFATEVVMALPLDGFQLAASDVVAWVVDLGSSQHDDLREERRARRLNELGEYDDDLLDPADAPVTEAGGGAAEGFESAEAALVAHATHADAGGDPGRDAFPAEAETDVARAVYGDADGTEPIDLGKDG